MPRLSRLLDQPPRGVCALCREPAVKWVGREDELPDGRIVRRAIGVCQAHYASFTTGRIDPPDLSLTLGL